LAGNSVFIDTSYVYAIINPRDQWHEKATLWQRKIRSDHRHLLTTEFVFAEIADGLSPVIYRQAASNAIRVLRSSPNVEVVSTSSDLFQQALELYEQREDKDWGLTDCTSFIVMQANGITDALITDEHFRQAGFNPLLLN